MNNNESGDRSRWKAEWLKERGDEMIESLIKMLNTVEEEKQMPLHYRETLMESLQKGDGPKEKKSGKPERYFHNKYSVQSIWNCKEDPEQGSKKQHVQYVDCWKEKQINNG